MLNVNTLIVVNALECTHASTVERRLPQLRGSGIGLGVVVALGTPSPPPPLSASAHRYLSPPHTLERLSARARHPNAALRGTSDT